MHSLVIYSKTILLVQILCRLSIFCKKFSMFRHCQSMALALAMLILIQFKLNSSSANYFADNMGTVLTNCTRVIGEVVSATNVPHHLGAGCQPCESSACVVSAIHFLANKLMRLKVSKHFPSACFVSRIISPTTYSLKSSL